jgi:guanylate kinase
VDYDFVSHEEFLAKMDAGEFLEWANVYGQMYGSPRVRVEELLAAGEDVALKLDVQGALGVKSKMPEARLVFLAPPSMSVLEERLRNRGTEDAPEIWLRLAQAKREIPLANEFDYAIVVRDYSVVALMILAILHAERCRVIGPVEYFEQEAGVLPAA